jgi:hypothetical protein
MTKPLRLRVRAFWEAFVLSRKGSWFSLLSFCFTGVLVAALAFAILVATATLALAFGQSDDSGSRDSSTTKAFAGVITDSYCGAKHSTAAGMSPAECTRACVRQGARYMLVNGERVYILAGTENNFDKLAGQRARIQGTLDGETIQVSSAAIQ